MVRSAAMAAGRNARRRAAAWASGRAEVTASHPARDGGGPAHETPAPRRVAIFVVVALALFMSSLDATIVATALHSIQHGLNAPINWTGWVITAYSVGLVLMLSLAGKLTDRLGRRRFFFASVAIFAGASLCCGLAGNIYLLVALRVAQAAGGAGFTPSATGIVVEHFGASRDKAVGLFGSIFPIGSMVGPIFGGLFVAYWSWRGIFFVNVPIGILLVALGLRYIPRDHQRTTRDSGPLDLGGMALLGIGMFALMLDISELGQAGTRVWSPLFIGAGIAAVMGLGLFARHVNRAKDPFIEPHFIAGRGFAAVNMINVLYGGASNGLLALVPLYAVTRYGINALGSGTLLTAEGIAAIVMSSVASMALRRTGYRRPIYAGATIMATGMVALAFRPGNVSPYLWLAMSAALVGIGAGLSGPASRNAGLQLAPERSGSLAALRSTGRQVGSITAISITTAILAQIAHPGTAQAKIYTVFAVLLVVAMPVIARVPEHRGAW